MRRSRPWRGGGPRRPFRGLGAGFNPRGFHPSAPPPRLNRPPWSQPPIPSLLRPFEPNVSSESYSIAPADDDFNQHNYQPNLQKNFQRGSHKRFQRGSSNYQHNRQEYQHVQGTETFESDRPPMEFQKNRSKFQGSVWIQGKAPSIFQKVTSDLQHNSCSFNQDQCQQVDPNPSEFNQGQFDFQDDLPDFNEGQLGDQYGHGHQKSVIELPESSNFEQDPTNVENVQSRHPKRRSSFRNSEFNGDQHDLAQGLDFQDDPQNFQFRPRNYHLPGGPDFNQRHPSQPGNPHQSIRRHQSNYQHEDEVDFSKPPPPFHNRARSTDYRSDHYDYSDVQEPTSSTEIARNKPLGRSLLPTPDYSGQRPPATDHYIERKAVDDSFNKSIGDTVDIIKKRLLDRQENPLTQQADVDISNKIWGDSESPSKREKCYKRRSRKESSPRRTKSEKKCARMKKKIVRELFKMDKNALHKFVDDPQSSAKFEYALDSLITESRNSLNRQMRSAAEKSLYGSISTRAECDKDDTVYEDTFMAQMQSVLDPRDIIMLTDIKPMVMAEINKVLELDEYGHHASYSEDDERYYSRMSHRDSYDSEAKDPFEINKKSDALIQPNKNSIEEGLYVSDHEEPQPLVEIRRNQIHNNRSREPKFSDEESVPKFPDNLDSLSDDEYTFAELDKQYHVAVVNMNDPIENSRSPQEINTQSSLEILKNENINKTFDKPVLGPSSKVAVSSSIDLEFPRMHGSEQKMTDKVQESVVNFPPKQIKIEPQTDLKSSTDNNSNIKEINKDSNIKEINKDKQVKVERKDHTEKNKKQKCKIDVMKKEVEQQPTEENAAKKTIQSKKPQNKIHDIKLEPDTKISKTVSTRRTEADDKVSHRKEKRKKCEGTKPDPKKSESNKKVLNKNIIINVNDCASKNSETCDTHAKSVFNLFFSKPNSDELCEDTKRNDGVNISYSDKYVKRKLTPDKNEKNKKNKTTSLSPVSTRTPTKEIINTSCQSSKPEKKAKLLPIDMFEHTVRKPALHTAHRNTTMTSPESDCPTNLKECEANPVKSPQPIIIKRSNMTKVIKMEKTVSSSSTQTLLNVNSRFTQTRDQTNKKFVSKGCQTEPFADDKSKDNKLTKTEDVMERMKQIDLEIQQLLQEKFKLYNNIESGAPMDNNIQSFGMAVVNMTPGVDNTDENTDENGMLETFANMTEEELQEIALQDIPEAATGLDTTFQENYILNKKIQKRTNKDTISSPREVVTVKRKKKNPPKIVIKLNKNSPEGSDSFDEYKVVKSPKKQKKVSFYDEQPDSSKESEQGQTLKTALSLTDQMGTDGKIDGDQMIDMRKPHKHYGRIDKPKSNKKLCKIYKNTKKEPLKRLKKKDIAKLKQTVRECSIVVTREIFSPSLLSKLAATELYPVDEKDDLSNSIQVQREETTASPPHNEVEIVENRLEVIEINEDNEVPGFSGIQLQDDMLDVSEDIVIDGNFDIDKPVEGFVERVEESVCDVGPISHKDTSDVAKESCKLYDFSASGEFGADMIKVSGHGDALVAMECVNGNFLAASIDGNVYHYDGRDGRLLATLRGSNFPLTCLSVVEEKHGITVYTGSLDSRIRYYDLETGMEKGPECNVLSPIQSMDRAWGTIFIGTRTGFVLQFECKNNMLIPVSSVKFSDQTILALRALKEGPRKVLLVASRSDQVTIKDAQTGLLLRTLEGPKMTVYCLLFEDGKVFCGTSTNQIQVFDFTSGANVGTHNGGKGVVCLRAAGGLLLAGCYDGCVYVYRARASEPIAQLRGPSNMLLSLAVVHSSIVASYKDRSVFMWKIPVTILQEMVL